MHQLFLYEAVKESKACKVVCFNDLDVVRLNAGATTTFALAQPNRSEKVMMAPTIERCNL